MKKAARKLVAAAAAELDAEMARPLALDDVHQAELDAMRGQADELDRQRTDLLNEEEQTQAELRRVRTARNALADLRPPSACRARCVCGECGPRPWGRTR